MSLIGWWPLHENSGQANDLSGNQNHGTVNGATQGVAGKAGMTAYSFDGNDDNVETSGLQGTRSVTLCAWFRLDSISGNEHFISYGRGLGGTNRAKIDVLSSPYEISLETSDGSSNSNLISGVEPKVGEWYHVVAQVNKNGKGKIWVNGNLEKQSSSLNYDSDSNVMRLGQASSGTAGNADAKISDARIYNRALTPQEIQRLYQWGSRDYTKPSYHNGNDSGAVSRWKFESGSVKADSWGNNTLTDNTSAGTTTDSVYGSTAKSFDGTDDDMTVGSVDPFSTGQEGELTYSAWFNLRDTANPQYAYGFSESGNTNNFTYIVRNNGQVEVFLQESGTTATRLTGPSWNQNYWLHIATVIDPNDWAVYVNGAKFDTDTHGLTPSNISSGDVELGDRTSVGDNYQGYIDDARIYNRALKPYEVQQLYQWGTKGRDMRKLTVNQRG